MSSNPVRNGGRIFFSRVNSICWILSGVRSTPVLPKLHVKDPVHSAKCAGGRLHLNTRTSLIQRSRSGLNMPLSRHSVGTYPETSSRATCQSTFGHSRLSSLIHYGLILAQRVEVVCANQSPLKKRKEKKKKEKKKRSRGMNGRTFSKTPLRPRKSDHQHHQFRTFPKYQ